MLWLVSRRRPDVRAVSALLVLTVVGAWGFLRTENVFGWDAVTFFYPWYSLLGEGLRSGDVLGWNPHQFSGAPFAADLQSGWTYLPAMLLFASLPLVAAAGGFVLLHLLLAGLSAYALARSLGITVSGALLAAVAYEFGGLLYLQAGCCFLYTSVMSWLPLAFLGAEKAIRSASWLHGCLWWGVSGLALSQILASWTGQGSYYALLALGGYVGYRTLLDPPYHASNLRVRLFNAALHGAGVLAFGFGLAAAGVLPRLEYNGLSNLAGGYPDEATGYAGGYGGWSVRDWGMLLEPGSSYYAGVVVVALAVAAPFVARGRFAAPYFAVLAACALVLSALYVTPLHSALYAALPYFEQLHPHRPERVMVVFYLGAALLAGATLSELGRRAAGNPQLLFPPALAAALLAAASVLLPPIVAPEAAGGWTTSFLTTADGSPALAGPLVALVSVAGLVLVFGTARLARWRGVALASVALLAFVDLFGAGRAAMAELPDRKGLGVGELAAYYQPTGAAEFLRSSEEPFRYASYAGEEWSYPALERSVDPNLRALEDNNRAMMQGLEQVQGYNPLRVARYDEYVRAMNGFEQNYHHTTPYEDALDSPLLDLLNTRYVVMPAELLEGLEDPPGPVVYEDDQLKVLENEGALPRAWIVHSARQVRTGQEALDLLSAGQVDPKETALLEEEPPETSRPGDPSADRASVTHYEADRIEVESSTGAPGLLVLSEVYYPAWRAYVDGEPAEVYEANHLFRAVEVPAGRHVVELRYESRALWVGMAISLSTLAALVALGVSAARRKKGAGGKKGAARWVSW